MVENVSLCLNTHLYFNRQKSNTDRVWKKQWRIQRDRYVYEILGVVVNYRIKHFSGVGSRHTEASPGLCNRCSRETYNYNTDLPLQHGPWERPVSRWLTHFWLIITTDFSEVYSHTPHTHTHTHTHTRHMTHVHTRTHTTAKQSNVLEQLASCVDVMIYGMKQAEVFTLILKAVHALSKSVFCIQVSRHYLSVLLVWQFSLQTEPVIR